MEFAYQLALEYQQSIAAIRAAATTTPTTESSEASMSLVPRFNHRQRRTIAMARRTAIKRAKHLRRHEAARLLREALS